ncbi:hypothetical protein [Bradyrhizobium sp. AUGA SZCCT0042]|uniref:hypothetical protein n=1 Tax=Bradyrhizobium sp. AUGA SZCCT0042 TaxID=2807651 RepID=UPI001BADB053|nr:hypothetical protein [Bradyrhizobium sp. AUGA SZCCT0042]MBR1300599.1 hypothetical protein [Bradyrhizobium sp. AUGA SZCCT0042]
MKPKLIDDPHIVLEMSDEPDCRFLASWLMKVAEAEALWSEALSDPDFEKRVADVSAFCVPSLECAGLEILCEMKRRDHVLAIDLLQPECGFEIAMLVQLGFFTFNGRPSYHITLPETLTRERVRQAAMDIVATASDLGDGVEVVQPESLVHTLSKTEAEAWRSRLIAMLGFDSATLRGRTIQ